MTTWQAIVSIGSLGIVALAPVNNTSIQAAAPQATPTFAGDVAPILYANCVSCHRPNSIAPMELITYEQVRPWANAIKRKVVARDMPPWFADPERSVKMLNDRRLTQAQIDTIAAWVDTGAPKGNDRDLPAIPTFADEVQWHHPSGRPPDLVVYMPTEVQIPAEGELPIDRYWIKLPLDKDVIVEAVENLPGNPGVVHHSDVKIRTTLPRGAKLDELGRLVAADGKIMNRNKDGVQALGGPEQKPAAAKGKTAKPKSAGAAAAQSQEEQDDSENAAWIAAYQPGWDVEYIAPGIGQLIPANSYVGFSVHYQVTGTPTTDRSRLGLWFAREPIRNLRVIPSGGNSRNRGTRIAEGKEVLAGERVPSIPPHADNWPMASVSVYWEDVTLYALSPHMHLRGKDMTCTLVYPDGREQVLLTVPKWDFNWQLMYNFEEPVKVPAGSKLIVTGHFDNSSGNRWNPSPDKQVFWSEQSWDEMFMAFQWYTIDSQENKIRSAPTVTQQ